MPRVHILYLPLPLIGQVLIHGLQLKTVLKRSLDQLPALRYNLLFSKASNFSREWYLVFVRDHLILLVLLCIDVPVLLR